MEFTLTTEQKAEALQATLWAVKNEMYTVLLTMGLDPDTFEPSEWVAPEQPTNGNTMRLMELVSSFKLIEGKLLVIS